MELNLFIRPTVDNLILIFPSVAWRTQPILKKDVLCQIKLNYLNEIWYGDTLIHDENVPAIKGDTSGGTTGTIIKIPFNKISSEEGYIN